MLNEKVVKGLQTIVTELAQQADGHALQSRIFAAEGFSKLAAKYAEHAAEERGWVEKCTDRLLDFGVDVKNTMSLLLAGIAAISLLVGGIGIMNIMLVSVSERTCEIGIRKAVGAKRIHIMLQFLCEACILSVLGGIIGILLSFGAVELYKLIASSAVNMNWGVGFAAIAFCAVIGVLFGGYPATKASRLQPIDALHTT